MEQYSLGENQLRLLRRASKGRVSLFLPLTSVDTADAAASLSKIGYFEKRRHFLGFLFYSYDLTPQGKRVRDTYK